MPAGKWFIKLFDEWACNQAYHIILTTDEPCHLWLRWSRNKPRKHSRTREVRGLLIVGDVYYCFTAYHDIEQDEAGDTITHTFTVPNWLSCQNRYFYFHGQIADVNSPSTSPIFGRHLSYTEKTVTATITDPEDSAISFFGVISSYPPTAPGQSYVGNSAGALSLWGCALRFRSLQIERCPEILEAVLWLNAWGTWVATPVHARLSVENVADAATFYAITSVDFWQRWVTRTGIVDWNNIPAWTQNLWYTSPPLITPLEAVLARYDWDLGNALVLFFEDFDQRTPQGAFNLRGHRVYAAAPYDKPVLDITYNDWSVNEVLPF